MYLYPLTNSDRTTNRQGGIALLIVLWMLALLSIIALAYSGMTRMESQLTSNIVRDAKARALAESGFWLGVNDLIKAPDDRRFTADGTRINFGQSPEQKLFISILDETGKIDLNKTSDQLLESLLASTGIDAEQNPYLRDAILDWRDRDQLKRVNGAEDDDYEAAGYPYGAKDGAFNSVEELAQIAGMTRELYDKLQPLVTIHSMQARVRLSTAPRPVLLALPGMTEDLVDQIIAERTVNDTAILASILPDAVRPYVFTAGRGNVYTITSEANVSGMIARLQVTVLLKRAGNRPITILDWQENPQTSREVQQTENAAEH